MAKQKIRRQYGLWASPFNPVSLSRELTFSDVAWDQDGTLVWSERHSDRNVLVVQPPDDQAPRNLNDLYSARAHVGYGGGDFSVGNRHVYFIEADSGRLYKQPLEGGYASPVTAAFGNIAAPVLSPDGRWLLFIHSYEDQDSVGIVDADGQYWPGKLVSGEDFYMQPVWHPKGDRIAWIAWNHPNMPWDGTYLRLGKLMKSSSSGLPTITDPTTIAGGDNVSIFQPEFSPDGRYLAYVSDEAGWWHIYLYDMDSGERRQLTDEEAEHGLPAWQQGSRTYAFNPNSQSLYFIRNQKGFASLWRIDLDTGQQRQLSLGEEYTWLEQIAVDPDGRRIAFIASSGCIPNRVVVIEESGLAKILRRSMAEDLSPSDYALPQAISWEGMDGGVVYGLFYAPQSAKFDGDGLPPLVVLVHGGPTSQRCAMFYPEVQFFTSRGYAVLQVNYRGSTGYGRIYRDMLRGNWGIYDVQDSVSGARYLVEQGLVEEKLMVIMGSSAGGFTVLKTLEDYPGFFKAGINLYGISNHFSILLDTHKFEAHYSDSLLGSLPEAADIYRQRSPINFIDKIQDPLAIFQGDKDRVVPRIQSDEVVASLKRRGIPFIYHVYEGEGHGFRRSETIEHHMQAIDRFLKQYVILT
jgi:dipeptidyl aminopeptidase/acylaminoacyl peptidase